MRVSVSHLKSVLLKTLGLKSVRLKSVLQGCGILALTITLTAAEPAPQFDTQVLSPNVGNVCYAVTVADVDGDQQMDVVAATENRVVWFQNPSWEMRVLIENQTERDNVCIAPMDIDGDGQVDFALGAGWTKIGTLQWITRGASLTDKWTVHYIATEGWLHRAHWGDVLGTGQPQLIVSPLNKTVAPAGVRLMAFTIPENPRMDRWQSTILHQELNALHNHWLGDLNRDGKVDVLTASMEGITLLERQSDQTFKATRLADGQPGTPQPQVTGAGEIKVGKLGARPFIVTVEPMHGTGVSVYLSPTAPEGKWTRQVIESSIRRGHALGVADFDGDGRDEIVLGHSDIGTGDPAGPGVFLYRSTDEQGTKWLKSTIDHGGIATEDLMIHDFNGDQIPDIVAGGRATHNVKLYTARKPQP